MRMIYSAKYRCRLYLVGWAGLVDGGGWARVAGPAQPRWEMWSEQRTEDQPPLAPSISPGEVAASTSPADNQQGKRGHNTWKKYLTTLGKISDT